MYCRKKSSSIWDNFEETGIVGRRKCTICGEIIVGTNTTNCHKHASVISPAVNEDSNSDMVSSITSEAKNETELDDDRIPSRVLRNREYFSQKINSGGILNYL